MKPSTMILVALVAGASCTPNPPAPRPVAIEGPAATHDPAVAPPADASAFKRDMRQHFAAIATIDRAIARGHLADARDEAQWLADHDEPVLEGWQPFVDEVRAAARAVIAAPDLPTAAALAAGLGRACSRCHEARTAIVTFAWEPAPDDAPALQVQMKRHLWATARLWEGLVGPSDEMWNQGASMLAVLKLDAPQLLAGSAPGRVGALAASLRALAARAAGLTDHDERAKLYGDLLSTCAGCHQLTRPDPVPGP